MEVARNAAPFAPVLSPSGMNISDAIHVLNVRIRWRNLVSSGRRWHSWKSAKFQQFFDVVQGLSEDFVR